MTRARGGGAGSGGGGGGGSARAMGAAEPDLYRDTWVRYLGEHREPRGIPGTDTGY